MPEGFVHSVKVPRIYKTAACTIKKIAEHRASLKELVYERKHPNIKAIYALAATALQNSSQLTELLEKTEILKKEPRLDHWLARILITELIWGKQSLQSEAKPVLTIRNYENQLRDALKNTSNDKIEKSIKKVEKPRYVRVNTLIMSVDDAIQEFKNDGYNLLPKSPNYKSYLKSLESLDTFSFIQDYHIRELFAFKAGTAFYDHDGYNSGALVLQDKASCLPANLLNPPSGSVVLDMCAAPGMKTTHLAAILNNNGKIYSIERNERRYQLLCNLIESSGANIVETINADALKIDSNKYPDIEYILVDPSCSGSGMDRIEVNESTNKNDPSRLKSLQSFQVFLLRHALFNFPTAKRVVYSTCSIYAEENEMVIDEILNNVGDAYKLVPIKETLKNEWINYSSEKFNCKDNCLYAKPSVDYSNGFFVAVFERNFDVPLPEIRKVKEELKDEQVEGSNNGKFNNQRKNRKQETGKNELIVNGNNKGEGKRKKIKKKKGLSKYDNDKLNDNKVSCEKEKSLNERAENVVKKEFNEENENSNKAGKNKRKKKKMSTEKGENGEKNEENSEETDVKKKKKKLLADEVKDVEKSNVDGEENSEKANIKKKRKKKKLLTKDVDDVEKNYLNGEEKFEETNIKKKKKKKKLLTENEVQVEENNEDNIEKVEKNKKKLKGETNSELKSDVNDKNNTGEDEETKKKKKRKYDSVEDNNSNENVTKKKRKKN
ncbi:nop2/Sun-like domain containing protein 5 isoform X1 [Cotesia typhae]|uniref:nop2/Sun-like domain containing protein 5 isoform X1 n=1 Tax=Cotesia typhae TaxID=2053667 RepID=UPI003D691CD8